MDELRPKLGMHYRGTGAPIVRTTLWTIRLPAVVLAILTLACSSGNGLESGPPRGAASSAPDVVDSILPPDEALRRFRAGQREVMQLEGGADSRGQLIQRFVRALAARDTAAFRDMALSRAEFAWLYYPTSVFSGEPFYQMPQLTWFLSVGDSQKGISRAVDRYGGTGLELAGYECHDAVRVDGGLAFWDGCLLRLVKDGESQRIRLFGSVVEREGRFKFYSYANDL